MDREKQSCGICAYWDDFSGVCFNSDSPMCADFTDDEYVCPAFGRREQ